MFDLEIVGPQNVVERDTPLDVERGLTSAVVLLPLRVFLAAGWLRAASEKLLDPLWWSGDVVVQFVADQQSAALPFFSPLLTDLALPNAVSVSAIIVICQLLVGIGLAVGVRIQGALKIGVAMNVIFVMAGRVNPSVFYLFMEMTLLFAIAAGLLGSKSDRDIGRPMISAAAWLLGALTLSRWIETIEPAGVIDDPAMILSFLCLVLATTSLFRWAIEGDHLQNAGDSTRPLYGVARDWLLCRSTTQTS